MNIQEQKVELVKQEPGFDGMLKHIERCGRVRHKSEDRITDNSAQEYVEMLLRNGHTSALEHGACYSGEGFQNPAFSKYSRHFFTPDSSFMKWSTNLRAMISVKPDLTLKQIQEDLLFLDNTYIPTDIQRVTFHITTSRAIVDELTKHRCASFSIESTRFCDYSNDKFNKEVTFITPIDWDLYPRWVQYIIEQEWASSEKAYIALSDGLGPWQTRDILPLSVKCEMYMTAFVDDWINIIKQILDPSAHPQTRALAMEMRMQLIKAGLVNTNLEPCLKSSY